MAELELNLNPFYDAIDQSLEASTIFLHSKASDLAPRDWKRPPKPLPFKWIRKNKPYRKQWVTSKWWKWYLQVSWTLQRSVAYAREKRFKYIIWVKKWPAEKYAWVQEFGNPAKNIPARPYLRKAILDYWKKAVKVFVDSLNQLLK